MRGVPRERAADVGTRRYLTDDEFSKRLATDKQGRDREASQRGGRPHLNPKIRQYLGDARGHWEGSTLVIETTNFTDQTSIGGNGNGLRHSDALTLTERVTRIDAQTMEYVVTVDDAKTCVKPFTMLLDLTQRAGYAAAPASLMTQDSVNVFRRFSVDRAKVLAFYSEAVGLETAPTRKPSTRAPGLPM
jgi:hypothetical protein